MRSRYSAYVVGDAEYLLWSWHPETRPDAIDLDDATVWRGLTVLDTDHGDALDAVGVVEFVASYSRTNDDLMQLRERSRFARVDGRWVYVEGVAG